jgi:hypothetical protein
MSVIVESRIVGTFLGYAPRVVRRLDDGSEWEQVGNSREYVYQERPRCRVIFDRERLWIEVEGTSGFVEVRRYTGRRWVSPGAYRPAGRDGENPRRAIGVSLSCRLCGTRYDENGLEL